MKQEGSFSVLCKIERFPDPSFVRPWRLKLGVLGALAFTYAKRAKLIKFGMGGVIPIDDIIVLNNVRTVNIFVEICKNFRRWRKACGREELGRSRQAEESAMTRCREERREGGEASFVTDFPGIGRAHLPKEFHASAAAPASQLAMRGRSLYKTSSLKGNSP